MKVPVKAGRQNKFNKLQELGNAIVKLETIDIDPEVEKHSIIEDVKPTKTANLKTHYKQIQKD